MASEKITNMIEEIKTLSVLELNIMLSDDKPQNADDNTEETKS